MYDRALHFVLHKRTCGVDTIVFSVVHLEITVSRNVGRFLVSFPYAITLHSATLSNNYYSLSCESLAIRI